LLEKGHAYYCYCNNDELAKMKQSALAEGKNEFYNGHCRNLTKEQIDQYISEGRKPTVRFKVPSNKEIVIEDTIKGSVTFNSSNIGGDFIIVRSDGVPVYNYIVVIDDLLMKITDVIRGEDHLSNTPKQILIAEALDFNLPRFSHMPLIMGEDKKKLSKRHGITSVTLYRDEGYLPEALLNYISMLGWSTESGDEIIPKDEIINNFSLEKIAGSSAIFDFKKLKWMNGQYIRAKNENELYTLFKPYAKTAGYDFDLFDKEYITSLLSTLKRYCELLSDIKEHITVFLDDFIEYDEDVKAAVISEAGILVAKSASVLFNQSEISEDFFDTVVSNIKADTNLKGKNLFMSCRAVITGKLHGPDLTEMMSVMGLKRCRQRIQQTNELINKT
jgi:nondiscriminating glutamyl-tRNA synthetase